MAAAVAVAAQVAPIAFERLDRDVQHIVAALRASGRSVRVYTAEYDRADGWEHNVSLDRPGHRETVFSTVCKEMPSTVDMVYYIVTSTGERLLYYGPRR